MDQIESAYLQGDLTALINDWSNGVSGGEPSRVNALDEIFAWKRGFINGWYGMANDGKSSYFDFMSVIKAKTDNWKFCIMRQEDVGSIREGGKVRLTSNPVISNLIWTLTGKTPIKAFSKKWNVPQISHEELIEAYEFITDHFYILYPKDRTHKNVFDQFRMMHEKYGIDCFLVDPFKSLITGGTGREDQILDQVFINSKEFAMQTNTCVNFIAHPKSMTDVREKGKNGEQGPYKIINQYLIAGGAAWDNNMDSQYSIYRPEKHLDPNNPKVHFYNLKQRQSESVGVRKGVYEKIVFDYKRHQYFFDGVCPMDGSMKGNPFDPNPVMDFTVPKVDVSDNDPDKLPF